MSRIFKYFFLIICSFGAAKAQLLVSPNGNAGALVSQIVGNNVTITNAVIKCNPDASGIFLANNTNLGLNNGILLCSGKATGAIGPNSKDDYGDCFNSGADFYDPNILSIEPEAKFDGCILEFDIIPVCNTLQIKYVFGSEEYPEYVGTKFNDVFAFFVTGPNPSGGSYNAYNIARLPNGTPVAINTINNGSSNTGPCTNCSYYKDNTSGASIQYDGLTVPLTASVNVQPCATYHLKLAIADAGDCKYDSGVFLEYQGISCANSQVPSITANAVTSMCDLNNGQATAQVANYNGALTYVWSPGGQTTATAMNLAPGNYVCTIGFQLPCPYTKTISVTVPHNAGFTASNAVTNVKCPQDVSGSATVTPSGGVSPYTYSWNTSPPQSQAVATGLGEGQYVCKITDASGCVKNHSVTIIATTNLTLNPASSAAICNQANGVAVANASGGTGPYTYVWNTSPVQTANVANGLLPAVYSVSVTDNAGCTRSSVVIVDNFFPTITFHDSIVHATCGNINGSIHVNALSGGTSPYSYMWSNGDNTANITGVSPGIYTLNVTDANTCQGTKVFVLNNLGYLPIFNSQKDDRCEQKKGWARAFVVGGTGPWTYNWSPASVSTTTTNMATNIGKGNYFVTVSDALGCTNTQSFTIVNTDDVFEGNAEIYPREAQVGENFFVVLHPGSLWKLNWGKTKDGAIITDTLCSLNYSEYGTYFINYNLTSIDGCKASYNFEFFVKDFMTLYFPNTFTPNGDRLNEEYMPVGTLVKEYQMKIYNRWGQMIFLTEDLYKGWDGAFKGDVAPQDSYSYKAYAIDYFGKRIDYVGHFNLIR